MQLQPNDLQSLNDRNDLDYIHLFNNVWGYPSLEASPSHETIHL